MALWFNAPINLTESENNPAPKLVNQLSIIHESRRGELVQYYINNNYTEEDKNTHAIGVEVVDPETDVVTYKYIDYPDAVWNPPQGRMTRQRIDRLGLKAFPGIGALAYYKLAYRNISQIIAPVNFEHNNTKAPLFTTTISADRSSITINLSDPIDPETGEPQVHYMAYRVCFAYAHYTLEYVTYDKTITVSNFPISATYSCYVIGYVNEGEICSFMSEATLVTLSGLYLTWPNFSPGNTAGHQAVQQVYVRPGSYAFTVDWLSITPNGVRLTPDENTLYIIAATPAAQQLDENQNTVQIQKGQLYYWRIDRDAAEQPIGLGHYHSADDLPLIERIGTNARLTSNKLPATEARIAPNELSIVIAPDAWTELDGHAALFEDPQIKASHIIALGPPKVGQPQTGQLTQQELIANYYAAQLTEVSHEDGSITIYAVNPPTEEIQLRLLLA